MEQSLREARPEKVAVVEEVREKLSASSAAILTEYRGLPVAQIQVLRRALRAAGGEYKVYKNTLVRRAANESGYGVLEDLLEGPTGIAFVNDDVAAVAKVLRDFARTNPNLIVKGGLLGSDLLDARQTSALAELPSREALLGQIAGLLAAPMQRFASLLQAVPQKFAYALSALIEQASASATEAAAPETPASEPAAPADTAASAPATEVEATDDGAADEVAAAAAPDATAPDAVAAEAPAAAPTPDEASSEAAADTAGEPE